MTTITLRRSEARTSLLLQFVRELISLLNRDLRRHRTARELRSLDHRLLRDIGIEHPSTIEAMVEVLVEDDLGQQRH